jgi:hypothetical protein
MREKILGPLPVFMDFASRNPKVVMEMTGRPPSSWLWLWQAWIRGITMK